MKVSDIVKYNTNIKCMGQKNYDWRLRTALKFDTWVGSFIFDGPNVIYILVAHDPSRKIKKVLP